MPAILSVADQREGDGAGLAHACIGGEIGLPVHGDVQHIARSHEVIAIRAPRGVASSNAHSINTLRHNLIIASLQSAAAPTANRPPASIFQVSRFKLQGKSGYALHPRLHYFLNLVTCVL